MKFQDRVDNMTKAEKLEVCKRFLEIKNEHTKESYDLAGLASYIAYDCTVEAVQKWIDENQTIEMSKDFSIVLTATKSERIAFNGDSYANFRDEYSNAFEQEFKVSQQFENEYIVTVDEAIQKYKILYPAKYFVVEVNNELIVVTEKEASLNNLKDVTLKLDRKKLEETGITSWEKDILTEIIEKIKEANEKLSKDSSEEDKVIANENDNAIIREIFDQYDLEDDEHSIIEKFGVDGLHMIRDAEGGMYDFPYNNEK